MKYSEKNESLKKGEGGPTFKLWEEFGVTGSWSHFYTMPKHI